MWAAMINATTAVRKEMVGQTGEERRASLIYKKRAYNNYKAFAQALLDDCSGDGYFELGHYYLLKSVKNSLLVAISENLDEFKESLLKEDFNISALYHLLSLCRNVDFTKNENSSSLRQLRVCIDVLKNEKRLNDLPNPAEGKLDHCQCLEFVLRYERAGDDAKADHKDRYEQALLTLITSVKSVEQKVSFFLKLEPESDRYSAAKSVIKACFMSRSFNDNFFKTIIKELKSHNKCKQIVQLVAAADRKTFYKCYVESIPGLNNELNQNLNLFSKKVIPSNSAFEMSEVRNPNPNPN